MPGRSYSSGNQYRYGFNGKEKDKEIAADDYDFGARIYDGRIGRWMSVDPSQAKYSGESPYNFSGDNPVLFIDPDGRDRIITHNTTIEFADGSTLLLTKTTVEKGVYHIYKGDDSKYHYSDIREIKNDVISYDPFRNGSNFGTSVLDYKGALDYNLEDYKDVISRTYMAMFTDQKLNKDSKISVPEYANKGGIRFTSSKGGNNGGPYSTYSDIKSENIDLLLAAIKGMSVTDLGVSHLPTNIPKAFQNVLTILDNIQKIAAGGGTISKWIKETKKLIPSGLTVAHCPIDNKNWKDSADTWIETNEPATDTIQGVVNEKTTPPSKTPLKSKEQK